MGVSVIKLLVPAGSLHACGWHRDSCFHLVEVSASAKQHRGFGSEYYVCAEEELKG